MGAILTKEFYPTTREQTRDFWFFLYLEHMLISSHVSGA